MAAAAALRSTTSCKRPNEIVARNAVVVAKRESSSGPFGKSTAALSLFGCSFSLFSAAEDYSLYPFVSVIEGTKSSNNGEIKVRQLIIPFFGDQCDDEADDAHLLPILSLQLPDNCRIALFDALIVDS